MGVRVPPSAPRHLEITQTFSPAFERRHDVDLIAGPHGSSDLRGEIASLEQENANYQEQVLRAYQKIKTDEAMVARAKKAMAIALTVLDDNPNGAEQKKE